MNMNKDLIKKMLEEYKETEKCLLMGINFLKDADYAKGKLDLIKVMIADLESLLVAAN